MLPLPVLEKAASEMLDYNGSGMSVMEMSHRSPVYDEIIKDAEAKLRLLMNIPDNYKVLFLQGGASTQFAAVPLNLMNGSGKAEYIVSGQFSKKAFQEAKKYGDIRVAASSEDRDHCYIPSQEQLSVDPEASYFYYCSNNTSEGTEWQYVPDAGNVPVVCDMSSDILSRPVDVSKDIMSQPVDVSKYGVIFAGVQKNMAPAGMAVVFVDKALCGKALPITPKIMDYQIMIDKDSMMNTPPCYTIYMLGLVLKWVDKQGGIEGLQEIKKAKAKLLYDVLDESSLFKGHADKESRSDMNVTFRTGNEELDAKFVKEATDAGFVNVKGHRNVGGMRASIYNAMPMEGAKALADFMREFEIRNK